MCSLVRLDYNYSVCRGGAVGCGVTCGSAVTTGGVSIPICLACIATLAGCSGCNLISCATDNHRATSVMGLRGSVGTGVCYKPGERI